MSSYAMSWGWGAGPWSEAKERKSERKRERSSRDDDRRSRRGPRGGPCGPEWMMMGRADWGHGGGPPWHWGGPRFGPGGHPLEFLFGPPRKRRGRGGPRGKRGDVRTGILLLLAEEPRSGYEIIRDGRERGGAWRPSSGSVYPMLQQLQDEGLVRPMEPAGEGRRRPYELTEEGRAYVEENAAELTPPWEAEQGEEEADRLSDTRDLSMQVLTAVMQVAQAGTAEQVRRAEEILAETRRSLYRLLAEEQDDAEEE
jgi:DNA-binding PadR family transcriptional regulator